MMKDKSTKPTDSTNNTDGATASLPQAAAVQEDHLNGDQLIHACKLGIPRPQGLDPVILSEWESTIALWDGWRDKFNDIHRAWVKADEEQATLVARDIRKQFKGKENAAKINEMIQTALQQLTTQRTEAPPVTIPVVEGEYLPELMTLRKRRVRVAQKRMQDFLSNLSQEQKTEDETAISRATLAAAKARILGRPHRYVRSIRMCLSLCACLNFCAC